MQLFIDIYVSMKTLLFPSEFVDNHGGVPQTIIDIVIGLSKYADFKIVVLCPYASEMSLVSFPSNVKVMTTPASNWILSRSSIFKTIKTVCEVYRVIRTLLDKDTWVITNHSVTSSLISLMPLGRIHEVYINRGGDFSDMGIASRIMLKKCKKHQIDFGIGISKRQVDLLLRTGLSRDKVFLIHDGLPKPDIEYKKVRLNKEDLQISTIGFISDLKNQMEGVRLIRILRDKGINARLNVYGIPNDNDDYHCMFTKLIYELGLTEYINICGFISGEMLFDKTDILISFSKSEGFGRTLVEGMLRYKPVIAWRGAGGPIDITENGRYGYLVENNRAIDYSQVIMQLLNNPDGCMKNLEDAYEYACRNFTTESMVAKYHELFIRICV